ncbi:hypothetical protein C6A85_72980, partial [Mycobacterium sp. ITM-2017-0098]
LSLEKRNAATEAFNHAINDFVNRVRHYMHVEDHDFDVLDRKAKQDGIPDTESAVTPDLLEDA